MFDIIGALVVVGVDVVAIGEKVTRKVSLLLLNRKTKMVSKNQVLDDARKNIEKKFGK